MDANTTNVSTETLIQNLRADLGRTAETISAMQAALDAIGHRYAELQYQLTQERAQAPAVHAPVAMTELGSALIKSVKALQQEPQQEGARAHEASHVSDTGAASASATHDDHHDDGVIEAAEDDRADQLVADQASAEADHANQPDGAHADDAADLDEAFDQVGAEPAGEAPAPAPARASVFGGPRRLGSPQSAAPAAAAATATASPASAPKPAASPAKPMAAAAGAAGAGPRTLARPVSTMKSVASAPAAAPAPAPAAQRQASAATAARLDPMAGAGGGARPRLRTLGGAGR